MIEIVATPKMFGAKADGMTDDTNAIQNALNIHAEVSLSDGKYLINGKIIIPPGRTLRGNNTGTIVINKDGNGTVFELTYLNEIYGFNIIQSNSNWSGNIFEVSSRTLENTDAPVFVNLRNKIHDLNVSVNSNSGTFIEVSAFKQDEKDNMYRVYGMWNNRVYNINFKGYIEYFCRTYCYKKAGTTISPWITVNEFRNINGDYAGYGWFGSKSLETMMDTQYYNYNIRVLNSVFQCYRKSKNFAFLTGGQSQFFDCIPYDWSIENETKQNAFLIRNINLNNLPKIEVRRTSGNFDLTNGFKNKQANDYVVDQCLIQDSGITKYHERNTFRIGDAGGTVYPVYKRLARFLPSNSTMSTHFSLHGEQSGELAADFSLTYSVSNKTLTSKYRTHNPYFHRGIKFYHHIDYEGYVNIYMKLTHSSVGWYIEYTPPHHQTAREYFIFFSVVDCDSSLNISNMTEVAPIFSTVVLGDVSDIGTDINSRGAIGYNDTNGLLGFGRKHYGLSYVPIVNNQEHMARGTTETVNLLKPVWQLMPKIIIQPLNSVTSIPYPSNISMENQNFIANNLEAGKKYLITAIYNE